MFVVLKLVSKHGRGSGNLDGNVTDLTNSKGEFKVFNL